MVLMRDIVILGFLFFSTMGLWWVLDAAERRKRKHKVRR